MTKHTVFSSDGYSLNFMTTEDYEDYKKDEKAVVAKHQKILKDKYGIWASNQNKYVTSVDKLNDFDHK